MSIDLHIHSTTSDGTMSPVELVHYAHKKGLSAIAITDHDTIDGVDQALAAGQNIGLEVVAGIELSVKYSNHNVHILGYLFDYRQREFHIALEQLQVGRIARNKEIIVKLNRLGLALQLHELEESAGSGQTGRPHIARLMVEKGFVQSMDEAFEKYLGQGGLAYTSRFVYEAKEAISFIQKAGGVAVLAHPLQLDKSVDNLDYAVQQLRDMGLDGIEVYYPNHSRSFRKRLIALAEKYSLLMTGGSDFHGSIRPGTTLAGGKNVSVPAKLLVDMKQRAEQSRHNNKKRC
ncbi:PHP domain-containing protein [Desulfopila sp. IMCC35006]|uniref:PHP domain-containing protein n=1 Tax=Desulfopila sp. IMCC35006 TaxID=2569542 RepID=UPI0010ADA18B|nr:PHP domain-containing protein [Desulfopila sp. IMCC35006]TKB27633.1 PHP domain-containing protein [Desulfopila sp. IMCC35006]